MNRAAKRLAEGAAFDGRTVHIESQPGALYDFEPLAASSKSSNSVCGLTSFRWLRFIFYLRMRCREIWCDEPILG